MEEEGKDSICGKATKGIPTEGASIPCKGKSIKKKVEEGRGEDSTCGQAMRSIARMEKEFSSKTKEKSRRTLWQRSTRESMPTRVRIVHR